ncbi:GntR family transcriptional regulator [Paenibacillus sp. CCS19]|uniref:FadR/GntR family transcriptional regulator n=1 Tax=Paenibacillus sp. CCS19 TaxID=3158387 RepID=UPI00255FB0B1|nr:FadR/GntR family transcriptional regulator [Paenibacillus cellulosilyticus]GMK38025.1 GntR family transcriptional regulator [Paenibacillus cellulosilyticus]
MEIEKLEKRNHYEEITEQIRGMITSGKLKVGDKLPSTKEMAERFGVGRSTMREALSALKAVGLIEIRQGGVCRVLRDQPLSEAAGVLDTLQLQGSPLLELLEARQSLEISNAAIAARKRTEADIVQLKEIVDQMQAAAGDDAEGERLDLAFHQGLAHATHNSIIVQLFDTIMLQTANAIRDVRRAEIYANRDIAQQLHREHSAIFEAIVNGDPKQASEAMHVHLQHVEDIVHKHVR